jgi:hypothetical protein
MMVKGGIEGIILKFHKPLRVAAAQSKKIYPERLNRPDWLAGISEGAHGISDHFSSSFLSQKW